MDRTIGYCGLVCSECPAYLATINNDEELRKATAKKWSEMYNADIKPENIKCNGCTTQGHKFHHCTECEMRLCGFSKKVKNCGHCTDYPCKTMKTFLKYVPDVKKVLDAEKRAAETG